jgi:outer membrane protein assembly factor BamB
MPKSISFRLFSFVLFLLSFVLFLTCSEEGTGPKPKPEGYQIKIPWKSLSDSDWPTYKADMQRTGRSKHSVNLSGAITTIDGFQLESSLVVDSESNILFPVAGYKSALIKINDNLEADSLTVFERAIDINTTPVILDSNNILVTNSRELFKISSNGNRIWRFQTDSKIFLSGIAVGLNGDIFLTDIGGILYALGANGKLKWKLEGYNFAGNTAQLIALSPDSKVLYLNGLGPSLFAVDIATKSVLWEYGTEKQFSPPLVDNEGNIYQLFNSIRTLVSFLPNGTIRWQYESTGNYIYTNDAGLTMDTKGNLYFATDSLYSFSYSGELRWHVALNGSASNLICDNSDQLLMVLGNEDFHFKPVIYSNEGVLVREIQTDINFYQGWPDILTHDSWLIPLFLDPKIIQIK